jgi:hypothetical protein
MIVGGSLGYILGNAPLEGGRNALWGAGGESAGLPKHCGVAREGLFSMGGIHLTRGSWNHVAC